MESAIAATQTEGCPGCEKHVVRAQHQQHADTGDPKSVEYAGERHAPPRAGSPDSVELFVGGSPALEVGGVGGVEEARG